MDVRHNPARSSRADAVQRQCPAQFAASLTVGAVIADELAAQRQRDRASVLTDSAVSIVVAREHGLLYDGDGRRR